MCLFVLSKFPRVLLFFLHNPQTSTGRRCVRPRPRAATNWGSADQSSPATAENSEWGGSVGYCIVSSAIASYCIVLYGIASYCTVLHSVAWYLVRPGDQKYQEYPQLWVQNYFPPNQLMTWVAAEPNHCWKSWAGGRLLLGMAAFFQQSGGRSTRGCFYSQTK